MPVYNEEGRLEKVLNTLTEYAQIIIIDDNSSKPVQSYISKDCYPNVIIERNNVNQGYISSLKKGINIASHDILITMDADGEHLSEDINKLIAPIKKGKCDIVFGKRPKIARPSEKFLLWIAKVLTRENITDAGTGFRAIRTTFAKRLNFIGSCTCGTLLQESHELNMKICEVEVGLPHINKPRKVAWNHFGQFFSILNYALKTK